MHCIRSKGRQSPSSETEGSIISDGIRVESPELTIHRGTHEIGGSCVELCSSSGNTRLIIDIGLPLVNADKSPFDWGTHRKSALPQLLTKKILPPVDGLYENDKPAITAVLLSHAHLDHYGLLQFVHSDITLYKSMGYDVSLSKLPIKSRTQPKSHWDDKTSA